MRISDWSADVCSSDLQTMLKAKSRSMRSPRMASMRRLAPWKTSTMPISTITALAARTSDGVLQPKMSRTRPETNSAPPTSLVLVRLAFAVRELCMNSARPRVDVAVGEVDGGVHRDVDERHDQHSVLHHRVVALVGGEIGRAHV